MTTYDICKKVIKNKVYESVEEMSLKLDVFLLNNRITREQYNELIDLLHAE